MLKFLNKRVDVLFVMIKSRLLRLSADVIYFIWPKRLLDKIDGIYRRFYSLFMRHRFYSAGTDCFFQKFNSLHNPQKIALGNGVRIGKMAVLSVWNEETDEVLIHIGNGVDLGDFIHITAINGIEIGAGTLTGRFVTITDNAHGDVSVEQMQIMPLFRPVVSKGPVIIGKNVWIGDKVTILPGITIGDGAIIGSNAVVTHDVPSYCIACGCPATYRHCSDISS